MTSQDVEIDDQIYSILRNPGTCPPTWVRIAMLQARMAGESGPVHRATYLVFAWNPTTLQVESGIVDHSASRRYEITKYFKNEFEVPNWTRVVVTCDIDGAQRATVTVDPAGPPESDYLAGFDDPIYQHLDEHRAELEALARRHYGSRS